MPWNLRSVSSVSPSFIDITREYGIVDIVEADNLMKAMEQLRAERDGDSVVMIKTLTTDRTYIATNCDPSLHVEWGKAVIAVITRCIELKEASKRLKTEYLKR